jgi:hypothetical protein
LLEEEHAMGGKPPQNPGPSDAGPEAPPRREPSGDGSFAGSKPNRRGGRPLTDEEAFAELHRRQRERARRK